MDELLLLRLGVANVLLMFLGAKGDVEADYLAVLTGRVAVPVPATGLCGFAALSYFYLGCDGSWFDVMKLLSYALSEQAEHFEKLKGFCQTWGIDLTAAASRIDAAIANVRDRCPELDAFKPFAEMNPAALHP